VDTYYFCDLEDFVKACATCGRNSTPFEGHENEWFDEDRYFDAMMDDYDRIEYEDETYFFYHG
jgi:hypothetical protein